jgi:ribosomal subunit interface protein
VDVAVRGHHIAVSDEFRELVREKLAKAGKLDPFIQRIDVELTKESNPRLADRAFRVELTCRCKGPVVRAEAAADEQRAALDLAMTKLESRLRRSTERRIDRKRHAAGLPGDGQVGLDGVPSPASAESAENAESAASSEIAEVAGGPPPDADGGPGAQWVVPDDGPMIVREKSHYASAMNLDQALYEMELVGHDFFLFVDDRSGRPSVVYRRRAYDYGVIRLNVADER